jgi:hypothetical protein
MGKSWSTGDVADKAQDLYSATRKVARQGSREANSFIHRSPVLSTLIGFGAGFLLSLLFRSRD